MPNGDPHSLGSCWCGADHLADEYKRGFEDAQRLVGGAVVPSVEDLALASVQHWEDREQFNLSDFQRERHHEMYCMRDAKVWHDRLRRVMEKPQLG